MPINRPSSSADAFGIGQNRISRVYIRAKLRSLPKPRAAPDTCALIE